MAERFYFPRSGTVPFNPTVDAGWEVTTVTRRPAVRKLGLTLIEALTNETAVTVPITTTQDVVGFQFLTEPLRAQTITGTLSLVVRVFENANTNNVTLAVVLRAITAVNTVRGTLFSNFNQDTEFPLTASAATRIVNAQAVTQTTVGDYDRLCLEIGGHGAGPTVAGSYTVRLGTSATTDFALTSGLTTDLNPWWELSQNVLTMPYPNNFQFAEASGISTNQEWRP